MDFWSLSTVLLLMGASCMLQGCAPSGGDSAPDSIKGSEDLMSQKAHGTCVGPPQNPLRWDADYATADRICCFNRHYAEFAGSWERTGLPAAIASQASNSTIIFYDSVTGKPLFKAPKGRSWEDFNKESKAHGWPSFRDDEVVIENVRVLSDGEAVSIDGTHLGHNLPDGKGNRYCINLVSVAGMATTE
mmetsp:Transcript_9219/g.15728  ORF Transcript_9219/g.15728 Transcript_9219/m.15728 type:complete len:189 (-) Transcript_9219:398-964(-)